MASQTSKIAGYAVQIHDMQKGYIHLLVYSTKPEAEANYKRLRELWDYADNGEVDDVEYTLIVDDVTQSANEVLEEINWRRDIDKNNVYRYNDDEDNDAIQIVNDVAVPIY